MFSLKVHNQLKMNLGLVSGRSQSTVCHVRQLGTLSLVDPLFWPLTHVGKTSQMIP